MKNSDFSGYVSAKIQIVHTPSKVNFAQFTHPVQGENIHDVGGRKGFATLISAIENAVASNPAEIVIDPGDINLLSNSESGFE